MDEAATFNLSCEKDGSVNILRRAGLHASQYLNDTVTKNVVMKTMENTLLAFFKRKWSEITRSPIIANNMAMLEFIPTIF